MPSGILVSHRGQFEGGRGGTQICSHEYHAAIAAAGITLTRHLVDVDQRLSTRLLKRVISSGYFRPALPEQVTELKGHVAKATPDFVFINQVNLAFLAPMLRSAATPAPKIVLLSHGLESTDLLHLVRLKDKLPLSGGARPNADLALGYAVRREAQDREHIDDVFVLSPSDAVLEQWVGARRTLVVPRVVAPKLLDWKPQGDRLGFVGTLDHAPNLEGLVLVLEAMTKRADREARVRVVGGPPQIGGWIASRFATVDYLGPLTDADLAKEAVTWNAFLHPIFCGARGCSTKLADPIGWGLPIVTTAQGRRGYVWCRGTLAIAETPDAFADECRRMLDSAYARAARAQVLDVLASSPQLSDIAGLIAERLSLPRRNGAADIRLEMTSPA